MTITIDLTNPAQAAVALFILLAYTGTIIYGTDWIGTGDWRGVLVAIPMAAIVVWFICACIATIINAL